LTLQSSVFIRGWDACIHLGFVIIYLNQSSKWKMINIPGCSEQTNFTPIVANVFITPGMDVIWFGRRGYWTRAGHKAGPDHQLRQNASLLRAPYRLKEPSMSKQSCLYGHKGCLYGHKSCLYGQFQFCLSLAKLWSEFYTINYTII
jgi:hypothetical protein